jgi:hypothetical protein
MVEQFCNFRTVDQETRHAALKLRLVRGEPGDEVGEVVAGEVPLEGLRRLVPVLELVERAGQHAEVLVVVGLEHLALDDREEDLRLIEPAGVVEADASVAPRSITSWCSSAREKRESGTPCSRGSPHATAFT